MPPPDERPPSDLPGEPEDQINPLGALSAGLMLATAGLFLWKLPPAAILVAGLGLLFASTAIRAARDSRPLRLLGGLLFLANSAMLVFAAGNLAVWMFFWIRGAA